MTENEFLILPGCDDTNRGDQALIWETVEVAKEAGFNGHFSMIATKECGIQSKKIGIDSLAYLLPHPSMHTKGEKDNRSYGISLKIKWAVRSALDLLLALPLSVAILRPIVSVFLSKDQKRTLNLYKRAKAAFVKGGGFLHDYGGLTDTYKIYLFLYHINLALSMGIPVYIMPNSFGPFTSKMSRWMVKKCLSRCRLVCSRESISKKALMNMCGIQSLLSRDLAMYLTKDSSFDVKKCLTDNNISFHAGKMVGITVRPYRFPGNPNADVLYKDYKSSVCNLIIWLKRNGYHPLLIEHVFSENYHERDIICIKEIVKMTREKGYDVDVFSDLSLNCRQMKSIYAEMDYLVGTRFHSVIFSLTENVPVIAITYGGNKGKGIMKDIGLSDFAIPIETVTGNALIKMFQELVSNIDLIKDKLFENNEQIKAEYRKIVSAVRRE